jgi:hypothetical protein
MSKYSYLLALNEKLKSLKLSVKEIYEDELVLTVNDRRFPVAIPKDQSQINRLAYAKDRVAVSCNLLNQAANISEDEAIGWLLLEDLISDKILSSWREEGKILCNISGKLVEFQDFTYHPYDLLNVAWMIRKGYTFEESPGEGLLVESPYGIQEWTTPFSCTCDRQEKPCEHKDLLHTFIKNRECFSPLVD